MFGDIVLSSLGVNLCALTATATIYIFGGLLETNATCNDLWSFNIEYRMWFEVSRDPAKVLPIETASLGALTSAPAPWPSARQSHKMVLSDDGSFIWLFGGLQSPGKACALVVLWI